jgi:hypothetical protein
MNTDISSSVPARWTFRRGMLLGLLGWAISYGGVLLVSNVQYAFLKDHNLSLSLVSIGICIAIPTVYLVLRRQWRCLRGMLLVDGIFLLLLLVLLIIGFAHYAPNTSYG